MKARNVARCVSVREFITVCAWLDLVHGKNAKHFDVLEVERGGTDRGLKRLRVKLVDGKVLDITAALIQKEYDRKARDQERKSASDIA